MAKEARVSEQDDKAQFLELAERTDIEDPADKDVKELRRLLRRSPHILRELVPGATDQVALQLLETVQGTAFVAEVVRGQWRAMSEDFTRDAAHPVELVLAEHAALCWLRMYLMEYWYTNTMHTGSVSLDKAQWAEKRLSATQRRYLRACETLARERKLIRRTPAIQVNTATAGGQQVNVVQTQPESGQPPRGEILEACEKAGSQASG